MGTAWIGQTIGNWRIDEKIGEGGCGQVFRGVDVMLDRQVAIKVLHPRLAERSDIAERFRVEAHAMARLAHPNVATLYSFHREADTYVMVMEFVEGDTFEALLKREGPMEPGRAVPLIRQALEGVDHAHRGGIVHRDLKATNLMLNDAGVVKVMDFGIAQVLDRAGGEADSRPVGTPEYMSPEQVRGEPLDGRADVYALGVLLFKLLTGRLPIRGDTPTDVMRAQLEEAPRSIRALAPSIPESVVRVVERAMAKPADERFESAAVFRDSLEGVEADAKTAPPEVRGANSEAAHTDTDTDIGPTQLIWEPPRPSRPQRRRRLAWSGAASAVAAVLIGFWLSQSGRVDATATDTSPGAPASAAQHRLPPISPSPPVGFARWPADLADTAGGVKLGPADFAAIPIAPALPQPIEPGDPAPPEPSVETTRSEPPKKERALRVAKPQNRPGRNPPVPAAEPPPAEPEPTPERDTGWVIRR